EGIIELDQGFAPVHARADPVARREAVADRARQAGVAKTVAVRVRAGQQAGIDRRLAVGSMAAGLQGIVGRAVDAEHARRADRSAFPAPRAEADGGIAARRAFAAPGEYLHDAPNRRRTVER